MPEQPRPAFFVAREVRHHATEIALRVNTVSALLGEMKDNSSVKDGNVDVRRQVVDVPLADVVIDGQPGVAWNVYVVVEIEAGGRTQRRRGRQAPVPGKIGRDDEFVATTHHRNSHVIQLAGRLLAISGRI